MSQRTRVARVVLFAALALGLSSCGFLGIGPWHENALDDTRNRVEFADVADDHPTLDELVRASQTGEPGRGGLDALIIGTVTAVETGRSLTWNVGDENEQRIELPFGDERSDVNTFHLTLDVSDVVVEGTSVNVPLDHLTIGVSHDPDISLDDVEHDYQGIGKAAFFLASQSPLYDYEQDVWSILNSQALIGRLGSGGEIDVPLVPRTEPVWDTDGVTVDDLRALALQG